MADESRTALPFWKAAVARLVGIPTMPKDLAASASSALRRDIFGQLTPPPLSQTRWLLSDIEAAVHDADQGDLASAARLCRAMSGDGVLGGVLSTRTDGLVRLPIRWSGAEKMVRAFEGRDRKRGLFATMFPAPELALLARDGIQLGVGVAEMLRIPKDPDDDGPNQYVMRRLDPEWLRYRWYDDAWFYNSTRGQLPIVPGVQRNDGGWWILHRPGGEATPWLHGHWRSTGRAFVAKEHAMLHRENYSAKLAQAARVAHSPEGATQDHRQGMLAKLIAWGVNQCFELPPGWEVELIESNGRGYDVFQQTIESSNQEFIVSIAGQTVTTDGGSGFANAEIHKTIRADLIQATADGLSLTINEQGIPPYCNERWGAGSLIKAPWMEWDTSPPKEMKAQAEALGAVGIAVRNMNVALQPYGRRVDIYEIATRFGVPIAGDEQPSVQPRESAPEEGQGTGPVADDGVDVSPVADIGAGTETGPGKGNGEKTGESVKLARTSTVVQALIFDRDDFEPSEARDWARRQGYEIASPDITDGTIRIRQEDLSRFERDSLRTIELKDGVEAVVGRLKSAAPPRLALAS